MSADEQIPFKTTRQQKRALDIMVKRGIFATRGEAIRHGLRKIMEEYGVTGNEPEPRLSVWHFHIAYGAVTSPIRIRSRMSAIEREVSTMGKTYRLWWYDAKIRDANKKRLGSPGFFRQDDTYSIGLYNSVNAIFLPVTPF